MAPAIKIGFDLGTNTSVICAEDGGKEMKLKNDVVFSVVGYAKANVLPGVLPGNKRVFYGQEAIDHRRYLDLHWPLEKGVVHDLDSARDFMAYIRACVDVDKRDIWACVGSPARTEGGDLEMMRDAMGANFQRFLIVPEPFLAALGIREDERVADPDYLDPVKHSMIVDIGAGTTDLCNLQGFYPTPNDQICVTKAGNDVDMKLRELIERKYPDAKLHNVSVTSLKEANSYVGTAKKPIQMTLLIHGKSRTLDVTELVGQACEIFVPDIVTGITELAKKCDQEIADKILANIILTGGGSQIAGIAEMVEKKVRERGVEVARVRRAANHKKLVAMGALKVAHMAREDQWQHPSLS